ncbi:MULTISPECIES: DUF3817 domain-containing protein [Weeksella]|uniref:DUF3817 domain-containing protein n=1 Tax=Weeksella virosa (strain ATCC 43766 / DSM 16922 / JCM 21250 / CCUG 30538 / CDC 9751 / IAM 14551 / NBRC 16016 / NCTC 11634 / CL345/78) TaxID=865938 RepID=F0NXZ9_WEEVC|nr:MULTISPECIES: DUF3817 domain-containing protein [Weeksella]ADX68067.1 hypothetical protein Weevi_1365 [Weeksella virosa DSM 16922]MDK7374950.1 DUF3817 domain-containing protein [Weeksella virosa]MDK7675406.1 DUF3817 domain-containing protein [Weeksella virosa]OFM83859.1 hypothetical protein HMPREF2660_10060 [Weeksella sp. HMSC059D05]SUP54376.1 integral membrane protein [Weeksella virosa]
MLKLFKVVGFVEAISAIALFFVAMPIKYIFDNPTWVTHTGRIHGGLFIAYVVILYFLKEKYNWSWKIFGIFFVSAIIPGGTIWADKRLIEGKRYKNQLQEETIEN